MHSLCGYKKNRFIFSDHSSEKRFRQNDDVPIVNLQLFFRRNPPDPWAMKKKWLFKTRQKLVKKKTSDGAFETLSCFEQTKKVSPYERNFLLVYHLSVDLTFSGYYGVLFVDA